MRPRGQSGAAAPPQGRGPSRSHADPKVGHHRVMGAEITVELDFEKRMTISWQSVAGVMEGGRCDLIHYPTVETADHTDDDDLHVDHADEDVVRVIVEQVLNDALPAYISLGATWLPLITLALVPRGMPCSPTPLGATWRAWSPISWCSSTATTSTTCATSQGRASSTAS